MSKSKNKNNNEDKSIKYFCFFIAILIVIVIIYLIVKQLEGYERQDDPRLNELKDIFSRFFNQNKKWHGNLSMLNNRKVMDEINLYRGEKSYTINKEKVYICLKDEKGEYYSLNMLIYVLAHEFAHVLCTSIGHTEEFQDIFGDLLVELEDEGIYDSKQEIVVDYCEHGDKS
jgi:hypothetical protein